MVFSSPTFLFLFLPAVLIAVFSQNRRLKEDAVIGVFFVASFALGIVIISRAAGYAGSLQQFLFGSITGIPDEDAGWDMQLACQQRLADAGFQLHRREPLHDPARAAAT